MPYEAAPKQQGRKHGGALIFLFELTIIDKYTLPKLRHSYQSLPSLIRSERRNDMRGERRVGLTVFGYKHGLLLCRAHESITSVPVEKRARASLKLHQPSFEKMAVYSFAGAPSKCAFQHRP